LFYFVFAFSVVVSLLGFLIHDSPTNLLTWLEPPADVQANVYTKLIPDYISNVLRTGLHGKYFNISSYSRHCLLAEKAVFSAIIVVAGLFLLTRVILKAKKQNSGTKPSRGESGAEK